MDIITEFELPSKGLVYGKEVKWKNRIRAPRLSDKGIGDTTKINLLQANILDKTILEPLGISAYDLHSADFLYLNLVQRLLAKGNKPYRIHAVCPNRRCNNDNVIDFDLTQLNPKYLEEAPKYEYKTLDDNVIEYTYLTPRAFDEIRESVIDFKETYPEADTDINTQEILRKIIVRVDGKKPTYSQMTEYIQSLQISDVDELLTLVMTPDFGLNLNKQKCKCTKCGKTFEYDLPV